MVGEELQSVKARFGIIGNSSALNHAISVAVQVAPTDMSVLITGESGTGKESFSKIIHQLSARKHNKFIAINCGAIPEGTIDSELFGHEKGAFTGASEARKGYFEVTDGGTIFLDEIGEMPIQTQTRLLRVLEYGEFIKVGSSKVLKTDIRIVAATNVGLEEAIEKGKFREDLYYRLSTVPISVPSLHERNEDVLLLFRKFSADFSEKYRTRPIKLTDAAKEVVKTYRFKGNIRQLRNIVEQMSVLETEREITPEALSKYLKPHRKTSLPTLFKGESSEDNFSERDILYKVLFELKNDVTELKKTLFEMIKDGSNPNQIIKDHKDLFNEMDIDTSSIQKFLPESNTIKTEEIEEPSLIIQHPNEIKAKEDILDIAHETEDEVLSLQFNEEDLIKRALKKHSNKRKSAAIELGISERTLYRKIKQYNL